MQILPSRFLIMVISNYIPASLLKIRSLYKAVIGNGISPKHEFWGNISLVKNVFIITNIISIFFPKIFGKTLFSCFSAKIIKMRYIYEKRGYVIPKFMFLGLFLVKTINIRKFLRGDRRHPGIKYTTKSEMGRHFHADEMTFDHFFFFFFAVI